MTVKYILVVFLNMQNGLNPIEAKLDVTKQQCLELALKINTESTTGRMATCMPLVREE